MGERIFNFSAGPAMLPTEVMKRAQQEFCNYKGVGNGIMELSHRSPEFAEVIQRAKSNIIELLDISDEYEVLFIQGGASMQFAMIPMNIMLPEGFANFADTGSWSVKAMKESKRFGEVKVVAGSSESNYTRIPNIRHWKPESGASYMHITSNNTIYGTQYHEFPETDAPLVADMSSDIMSRKIDIDKFGIIYAGAQKNLGPSGVALVILRKDLAKRTQNVPTMLDYNTYIKKDSMFNTPPTFAIYMLALVSDWLKEKGGLKVVEEINDAKSEQLYELIDKSSFYNCPVNPSNRSRMNVVFTLPENDEKLNKKFLEKAGEQRMMGLKGHRSVGGMRASIYNAMPLEGVSKLIDFMIDFEERNS